MKTDALPLSNLCDYHLHTPLCHHASGSPAEYARAAIEKGLSEIGFADHNPMPKHFDDWRMSLDDLPNYFAMIQEARESFPALPIRSATGLRAKTNTRG